MSSCTHPLLAARLYKPAIGKQSIKILPKRWDVSYESLVSKYGQENLLELPCGHCPSCIANKKKEWAVRCCLEAAAHDQNCFVTLTYDDEHYDNHAHKDHLKKFFRRLREVCGVKCRYYGCSERGDELGRVHYHIILFGYFPSDSKPWIKSQSGFYQYRSKILESCWPYGLITCSEFHPAEASYVAGYATKKLLVNDPDMFHFQSTKPGIGQAYVLQHAQEIYDSDKIIINFGSHKLPVPRYFDKVVSEYYSMDLDDIKAKRLELANLTASEKMRDLHLDHRFKFLAYLESLNKSNSVKRRRF